MRLLLETTKTFEEFETSLSSVIDPLVNENHEFRLGGISCGVSTANSEMEVPVFEGVPQVEYSFCIAVQKVDYDLWGPFDLLPRFISPEHRDSQLIVAAPRPPTADCPVRCAA